MWNNLTKMKSDMHLGNRSNWLLLEERKCKRLRVVRSRKEIAEGVIYNVAVENEVGRVGGEIPLETVSFLQRWPKT